jgi:hypothetical protein
MRKGPAILWGVFRLLRHGHLDAAPAFCVSTLDAPFRPAGGCSPELLDAFPRFMDQATCENRG